MNFTFFKDVLFDLINDCEQFDILDIEIFDRENRLVVYSGNGNAFELRLTEFQPVSNETRIS